MTNSYPDAACAVVRLQLKIKSMETMQKTANAVCENLFFSDIDFLHFSWGMPRQSEQIINFWETSSCKMRKWVFEIFRKEKRIETIKVYRMPEIRIIYDEKQKSMELSECEL